MTALRALSPAVRGSVLIVMGATFAGIVGPLARLLYDAGMTPFSFVVWRGIVAGAALWLVVFWRRRRSHSSKGLVFAHLPPRERLALLAFVAANVVLNTSLFVAFDRVPIAIALLTFYTYPVLLALYGRASGTERLGIIKIAALGLSITGLALVVTASADVRSGVGLDPLGLALGFLASLAAATWVGFGRACPSVPAEQAMGLALGVTVLAVGIAAIATGPLAAIRFPLEHPETWPTILVSGVISGAGAAVMFTMGIRLISRVRAGILGLIEPIVGTAAAALLLGQILSPVQLLGGALVLGAAVLIQRDAERAPAGRGNELAGEGEITAPVGVI
jgi:drug/metabolite transporter (DMT)-like permease